MSRVYIAGPMTGQPDFGRAAFAYAATRLLDAGHEPVSPVHDDDLDGNGDPRHTWEWYMRRDLGQMLDCDGVAYLDGWLDSRGASLEVSVASQVGIECRPLEAWLR